MASHYEILEVDEYATAEEIRESYYRLARLYHPDRNHAPDATRRMAQINRAYAVLGDPAKRAAYARHRMSNQPSAVTYPTGETEAYSRREQHQPRSRPENEPLPDSFTVGSPKSDVFNLQGPPDNYHIDRDADKEVWHYGRSFVEFSLTPRVVRTWEDPDRVLRARGVPPNSQQAPKSRAGATSRPQGTHTASKPRPQGRPTASTPPTRAKDDTLDWPAVLIGALWFLGVILVLTGLLGAFLANLSNWFITTLMLSGTGCMVIAWLLHTRTR